MATLSRGSQPVGFELVHGSASMKDRMHWVTLRIECEIWMDLWIAG